MKKTSVIWLVLIQFVLAYEWLHSGYGKWVEAGFMTNIGKTLNNFADKTPYTLYGDFLQGIAVPNSELFGNVIRTGEILVGITLIVGGILLFHKRYLPKPASWLIAITLLGGAFMNLNFFLAAGSTSPSTWGVNMVMGFIHLILAIYYISNHKDLANE